MVRRVLGICVSLAGASGMHCWLCVFAEVCWCVVTMCVGHVCHKHFVGSACVWHRARDLSVVDVAKRRLTPRGGAVAEAGRQMARALQGRSAPENRGSGAVEQS